MIVSVTEYQAEALAAEKRRRRKHEQPARDQAETAEPEHGQGAVRTGAHDVGDGYRDAMESEAAKAIAADPAPSPMPPRMTSPEQFRRPYDSAGHAANSPQAGPPNVNPMPSMPAGVIIPVALPDAPMAIHIHPQACSAWSDTSPSLRGGR